MIIGYARVSSAGQSLEVQYDALRVAGCEKMFSEKRSGRSMDGRPALQEAIDFARAGDTLVVTRLDRLARSTQDLHNICAKLEAKGVGFRCLTQSSIDTTTPAGKLTLSIVAAVASFELDLRAERQAEGIARARSEGKYRGRSVSTDYAKARRLKGQGLGVSEIAELLGCGRTTIYRALSAP